MQTMFVEVRSDVDVISAIIHNLHKITKFKKIGLFTTVQHIAELDKAKNFLEKNGLKIIITKSKKSASEQGPKATYCGQLLGCDASASKSMKVDAFLYIGTGEFHPLAISIASNKPVMKLNPLSKKLELVEDKARRKWLARQAARVSKLADAKKIGIILSTKPGQYTPNVVKKIKKKYPNSFVFITDMITANALLDFPDIDVWVNTACPRLVDDCWPRPFVNADELLTN
jgi:2-(3-amino-3-carboxypropyl)histidine synthase